MKKLIYFTLGNNLNYIDLLELCVKSLLNRDYDGDFLFITDFEKEISHRIKTKNNCFFLNPGVSNLLGSSANKLKIYSFEKIQEYDKIIFCDSDILWLKNPDEIFETIQKDQFYMTNENGLMSDDWWGKNLLVGDEKTIINENKIKGVNAGFFAFNKSMVPHLQKIEKFLKENTHLVNSCLEQPFINIYVYRNSLYNVELNSMVSHNGYNVDSFDGTLLHFAGGPGNYITKIDKMKKFFDKNISYKNENHLK